MRIFPSKLNRMLSILTFITILMAYGSLVFAQTTGKIAGVVKEQANGEVMPGVNVIIVGTSLGASTDSQGRYFIINVPPGTFTVKASFIGYKAIATENVQVSVGLTSHHNFLLETSVIEGEEVVVLAEAPLVEKSQTATASKYGATELNNTLPVANINQLIESTPSVYRGFIRGGSKAETKTLVDGVDVTDAYFSRGQGAYGREAGHFHFNMTPTDERDNGGLTVSASALQELQVFSGTFGAEFPAATAGIVNVVTKEGGRKFTFNVFNRTQVTSGKEHQGSNIYHDADAYLAEGQKFTDEDSPRGALYTWTPQKAKDEYNYDPSSGESLSRSHETNFTVSGPLGKKGGFFVDAGLNQTDGAFPFDRTKRINGSFKAHYNLASNQKLTGMFQFNDGGEFFDFVNWKYNPRYKFFMEGAPRYKDLSTVGYLKYTHTLNAKTFYEVRASRTTNISKIGYPDDDGDGTPGLDDTGDFIKFDTIDEYIKYVGGNGEVGSENGFVFGSTDQPVFFSSTLNPAGWQKLNQAEFPVGGIGVNGQYLTSYPIAMYQEFGRDKVNLKVDLTSQVTYNHQIKAGASYTRHSVEVNTFVPELYGRGEEFPTSKAHVQFLDFQPQEFAAYIQDQIEFEGLIVNIGARVDGFDNDTELFSNEWDPVDQVNNEDGDFLRYDVKRGDAVGYEWFFSPRIGVSHPVTNDLAMHYSFGRYFQYPNYATLYEDYNFTNYAASPSPPSVRPDQDPIRSINYEIGAQWSFTDDYLITGTGYYRDVEKTGSRAYTLTTSENLPIRFNTTWGYSDARGIELELSKRPGKWWGGRLSYAFSYIKQAGGVGSFQEAFSAGQDSTEFARLPWEELERRPSRERNIIVTQGGSNQLSGGFDRPHRLNGTLQLFFPAKVNATFIGEWTSGFYYQQFHDDPDNPDAFFDRNLNLGIGPSTYFVNARLSKLFNFSSLGLELFFEARNLFNRTNIRSISNEPARETFDREIWELGRPDNDPDAAAGARLSDSEEDPEGSLQMPTDSFGRPYYLNAREFYLGVNINLK